MKSTLGFFLLYVSVILLITFLQQEFVLLPELHGLDIVGEDTKIEIIDKYQKWRWFAFLVSPILLLVRLFLVSLCLYVGGFFFSEMGGHKYKEWWTIALIGQSVLLVYSILLCCVNIVMEANQAMVVSRYTSLLFCAPNSMQQWIKVPLTAINIFEIAYWIVMAALVSRLVGTKFRKSFKFVISSYGAGYLFYIVLLMFLMLYLG